MSELAFQRYNFANATLLQATHRRWQFGLIDQTLYVETKHFITPITKHGADTGVGFQNVVLPVGQHNPIGSLFHERTVELFALPYRLGQ